MVKNQLQKPTAQLCHWAVTPTATSTTYGKFPTRALPSKVNGDLVCVCGVWVTRLSTRLLQRCIDSFDETQMKRPGSPMINLNRKYIWYTRAVAARVGAQDLVATFKAAEEEALISLQAALGNAARYSGAPLCRAPLSGSHAERKYYYYYY